VLEENSRFEDNIDNVLQIIQDFVIVKSYIIVLCVITMCSVVEEYKGFGVIYCFPLQGRNKDEAYSDKKIVSIYETTKLNT
jgi:hypothetical protein